MKFNLTITDVLADELLETAYQWLCKRRRDYPPASDVWSFRRHWLQEKERIREEILGGRFRFSLLERVRNKIGEHIDLWCARDALVLKALTLALGKRLPSSTRCAHLKGNGGSKGAVREVCRHVRENQFVLKTDIKSYYASIDHFLLMNRLCDIITDGLVLNLIHQYLKRCAERGGQFRDYERGIPLGCPLSLILASFFLLGLDARFENMGLFYIRFMDDILVLAPSRWKLRQAVRRLNQALGVLGLEKQPAKTFIGRIERGFDFLGYHFTPAGLFVAAITLDKFMRRAVRLYERGRGKNRASLGPYAQRWMSWVAGGLGLSPITPEMGGHTFALQSQLQTFPRAGVRRLMAPGR